MALFQLKNSQKRLKPLKVQLEHGKKGFIPQDCFKTIGGRVFVKVERAKAFLMA